MFFKLSNDIIHCDMFTLVGRIETRIDTSMPNIFLQSLDEQKCMDKQYCQLFPISPILCMKSKSVLEDCMMSCGTCKKCIDDEKCKLIDDLSNVCRYVSDIKTLCPKSCGNC